VEGAARPVSVRVRNLSRGGMMVDNSLIFQENDSVLTDLRGIGEVAGKVAWVTDERAGVVFDNIIDPKDARKPLPKPPVLLTSVANDSRRPGLKPQKVREIN